MYIFFYENIKTNEKLTTYDRYMYTQLYRELYYEKNIEGFFLPWNRLFQNHL